MYEQSALLRNGIGLHSWPASRFFHTANQFESEIWIGVNDRWANAKSLLSILGLGIDSNTKITLRADGADERKAIYTLIKLIQNFENKSQENTR